MKEIVKKDSFQNPKNLEEKAINMVGKELYESFIKNYTLKQWGKNLQTFQPA